MTNNRPPIQALMQRLHQIPEFSVNTEEDLKHLQAECKALRQAIKDLDLRKTCPDAVWGYLTDVDVRFEDFDHIKHQLPLYLAALSNWSKAVRDADNSQLRWKDSKKLVFNAVLIFLGILLLATVVVKYRENSCARQCIQSDAKGYRYQGLTGINRSIKADSCSCIHN